MEPLTPLYVAVGSVAVVIATLSVSEAVKVTVCVCEDVVREILELLTLKLLIVGSILSDFVILIVSVEVDLLPAASVKVTVKVSLCVPYV